MNEGFTKIEHSLWECDLTMEERYMMLYLLDCENRFNKKYEWFGLTDEDFINIGFGRSKEIIRRTRNSLIDKGMIAFQRGSVGEKSQYMINRNEEKVSFESFEIKRVITEALAWGRYRKEKRYLMLFLLKLIEGEEYVPISQHTFTAYGFDITKGKWKRHLEDFLKKGLVERRVGENNVYEYRLNYDKIREDKKRKKKEKPIVTTPTEQTEYLNYEDYLKKKAEELSNNMTRAEKRVAKWLDDKGIQYIPQCPIMCYPRIGYIADFVLPDYNAIIEVDGETHNSEEAKEKDALRTKHLNNKGYRVYRIDNKHTKDEYINSAMADIVFDMGWEKEADRLSVKVVNCDEHCLKQGGCETTPIVLGYGSFLKRIKEYS